MSTPINRLSTVASIAGGDFVALYDQSSGEARKTSVTDFSNFVIASTTPAGQGEFTTQYAGPSSTGFDVELSDGGSGSNSIWLVLTPTATFATGTLTLPLSTSLSDKQEILVNSTQAVTALTIDGNGATVTGAPSSIAANGFFRLKFDAVLATWYRVG